MKRPFIIVALALFSVAVSATSPTEYAPFLNGERTTYNSGSDPKAKGIEVSFDYPLTWEAVPGKRPNVLVQVTSRGGKGLELCNITVTFPLNEDGEPLEPEEVATLFTAGNVDEFKTPGTEFIAGEPTTIDSLPAFWVLNRSQMDRAGMRIKLYSLVFFTYYDSKLIAFQCMVAVDRRAEWPAVQERMREFAPLFQQMAASIIVHSQWR